MMDHVSTPPLGESRSPCSDPVDGDDDMAQQTTPTFRARYGDLVADGSTVFRGGRDHRDAPRSGGSGGVDGSPSATIIDSLGDHVDLALSPADVGRGRPFPGPEPLGYLLRLGGTDMRALATVGDTAFDVLAGRASKGHRK